MPKYRNISNQTQVIIGVSEVKAGAVIEADDLRNQNFEEVRQDEEKKKRPAKPDKE